MNQMNHAIELLNITKEFPGVVANDDVTIRVREAEIHGLIGENGAGKSTIMNILFGMQQPDRGEIKIFGETKRISSPADAIALGIGMVHQHFMLMENQTVLRNIILGQTPVKFLSIDEASASERITEIMEIYGLHVDLKSRVSQLSVGEKQRVEILKALYREARILILDEPTAVLTPSETDNLLEIIRKLKSRGCTIIFITHKLREVKMVTDRVTVMRKGKVTGFGKTSEFDIPELSRLVVGREVELKRRPQPKPETSEPVLEVNNLSTAHVHGRMAISDITFNVCRYEILGIAGVEGNGQTDLIEAIAGMIPVVSGEVLLEGQNITNECVRVRRKHGLGHIPEDRLKTGIAAHCTIAENLILNRYYDQPISKMGIFNKKEIDILARELCERFQVKTPDPSYEMRTLSGGNMQKVVFAREHEDASQLLIAAQPTRGVDIGATEYIHDQLIALRNDGKGVLLVSAELDEILALCDRILVIYEGEIVGCFVRDEIDEYTLGEYMLGARRHA